MRKLIVSIHSTFNGVVTGPKDDETNFLPGDLERQLEDFITHYNTRRYHESLNNLTPECVFTGESVTVLKKRNDIKLKTIALRKRLHFERRAA
jgi:Integrase core domain